jgi:hypothetical protein
VSINRILARRRFHDQRGNAKAPFELTFEEWLAVWEASGRWAERGRLPHQYCMARLGPDIGPYRAGNVKIITNAENNAEQRANRRGTAMPEATKRQIAASVKAGWTPERRAAQSELGRAAALKRWAK